MKLTEKAGMLTGELMVMTSMLQDYANGEIPEDTICDPELEGRLQELDAVGKIKLLKAEIKIRREELDRIRAIFKGA